MCFALVCAIAVIEVMAEVVMWVLRVMVWVLGRVRKRGQNDRGSRGQNDRGQGSK